MSIHPVPKNKCRYTLYQKTNHVFSALRLTKTNMIPLINHISKHLSPKTP